MKKKIIFLDISPHFIFIFHFIVKKDMEWTLLLKKKKIKKKILTSYPFSLLLFLFSSGVGTRDVTQCLAAKSSSAELSFCKYRLGNTGGTGEQNRPGKRNKPPPPTPKGRCGGSGAARRRNPLLAVSVVWLGPEQREGAPLSRSWARQPWGRRGSGAGSC